jgi:hypothetical protein
VRSFRVERGPQPRVRSTGGPVVGVVCAFCWMRSTRGLAICHQLTQVEWPEGDASEARGSGSFPSLQFSAIVSEAAETGVEPVTIGQWMLWFDHARGIDREFDLERKRQPDRF